MKQMKLQTGLVITLIALSLSSSAQGNEQKSNTKSAKTYLDLMINIAGSSINYGSANAAFSDYKKGGRGLQAGVSFQAGVTSGFSLVSELYYMRKGGKLLANNPLTTNEASLRLNTLELPVLTRFHFGRFYVNAGPSIAYNLSGKSEVNDVSTKLTFDNSATGFKRLEAGLQAGGGVEFPFKKRRIALDLRYNYGLTNISRGQEMYNRSFIVSIHISKAWRNNPLAKN